MRSVILRITKRVALLAVLSIPLATWAFWKPIRALAPEWAGVTCYAGGVCTDDPSRIPEALALKRGAIEHVERKAGLLQEAPRVIFCTTTACEKSFGFTGNAAYNVGASGLVVSSRGWQPHFIRHELIHHLQVERIGGFRMLLHTPTWLIEGMAYSMSEDPRHPLQEPWESYRTKYEQWASHTPAEAVWVRAKEQ